MKDLKVLFSNTADIAVRELEEENFQEIFDGIMAIRQKFFNGESFFEIAEEMINLGIMPESIVDFSYVYEQLTKAEVRLIDVKRYVNEKKRISEMSEKERAIEVEMYGIHRVTPKIPKWSI